ncbi:MAG: hypothetical protein ACO3JT_09485, partial [Candidatus Nanopelagicales bacterium]
VRAALDGIRVGDVIDHVSLERYLMRATGRGPEPSEATTRLLAQLMADGLVVRAGCWYRVVEG